MRPNILLLMVDQMRGDCIGATGHPVVETPHLDMMKRDGVMFENAYCAVPSCIAARASLFTGMTPVSHGRVGYEDMVPWNYEHTLPGELAKSGYHTQCVGKMHVYPERHLLGFHNVILHNGYLHYNRSTRCRSSESWNECDDYLPWLREQLGFKADVIDSGLNCNSWVARPWPYDEYLHPTNWVVHESIDFLRRRDPTKPFFLMSSFVRPHSPLDPPAVYYEQYIDEDIPDPPIGDWAKRDDRDESGLMIDCMEGIIGKRQLKRARAAYYGLITHIDHQIGRLLQALHDHDVLHNTLIVFTSDHGDLLGDHNLFRKSLPYEGSINIPLIIYDPGNMMELGRNRVISEPVELMDIMPTLLDAAGVCIPETVEGSSVLPLIRGEDRAWREYIHGEHSYGKKSNHFIVTGKEKYIWYSQTGREQYFDLENDPEELYDLAKDSRYIKQVEYWRNILIGELEGRGEGYTDGEKLIVGRPIRSCLSHIIE